MPTTPDTFTPPYGYATLEQSLRRLPREPRYRGAALALGFPEPLRRVSGAGHSSIEIRQHAFYPIEAVGEWFERVSRIAPGLVSDAGEPFALNGSFVWLDDVQGRFSWDEAAVAAARALRFPTVQWRHRSDGTRHEAVLAHEIDTWAGYVRTLAAGLWIR
jgi:hypothetical protein